MGLAYAIALSIEVLILAIKREGAWSMLIYPLSHRFSFDFHSEMEHGDGLNIEKNPSACYLCFIPALNQFYRAVIS